MERIDSPLLSYSVGLNHFSADPAFVALAKALVPPRFSTTLDELGQFVGDSVLPVGAEVDHAPPLELISHDIDGNRIDRARLSQAHTAVYEQLRTLVATPSTSAGYVGHFLQGYLVADPGFYCLITLSTQVASALRLLHPDPDKYLTRLIGGPSWGATWFTEIQAGSDLSATRTIATPQSGTWTLSAGDKYFASGAGLSDLAITSAYPANAT